MPQLAYPPAPTADQVDDFHGTAIADPYRPLEDSDAPLTRAWIDPETMGPTRLINYAWPYFALALPNILITSAIFFDSVTPARANTAEVNVSARTSNSCPVSTSA